LESLLHEAIRLSDRTTNDEALLERARDGDHQAFHLLYKRHRDAIFRFLYRLSGSIEVAEDLTHDSFLQLIKKPTLHSAPDPLRHQLYSTARNLAMEQLRHGGLGGDNGLVRGSQSHDRARLRNGPSGLNHFL
jgi:DNA-directed RNA polymerase specialized sigma24 family protein